MRLWLGILLGWVAGVASARTLEPASSAEFCGRCHDSILEAWKTSAHARAMESPLFQQAWEVSEGSFGETAARTCLNCHAPLAVLNKDVTLRQKVSWEGVTCDYCHSLRSVTISDSNPKASIDLSLVKSGPLKDAVAPVHQTRFSEVHVSALVCAPCHEYRNSLGFPVLTTYSEWQKSSYGKQGRDCQSCHMYKVAGDVVDPKIMRLAEARVNLHQMPGSHSIDQLNKTIKAQLTTSREGNQLKVVVDVANVAAGHYVPTGSPMRQLILEVTADPYGGAKFRQERVYKRTVVDKEGTPITMEPFAFMRGVRSPSDTRLAPGERRTETFTFPIPAGTQTQVQATLWYYYSPLAEVESQRRLTFLTLRRLVK